MRRVIIGSMIRSGSAWAYNATKLLFDSAGYSTYASLAKDYRYTVPADIHIVQVHPWTPSFLPGTIIACVRDCRDAIASAIKLGLHPYDTYYTSGLTRIRNNVNKWIIEASLQWVSRADHVIRFEDLVSDKPAHLQHLADILFPETKLKFDFEGICSILEELPYEIGVDPSLGYARAGKHCTGVGVGGGKEVFRNDDYHRLSAEYSNWLTKFGYTVDL